MASEPSRQAHTAATHVDTELATETMPILSTTDRGARMTQLRAGQPVGRLSGNLVLRVLLCTATWAVASSVPYVGLLGLAPTSQISQALGSPWAVVAALVLGYFAIIQSIGIHSHAKAAFGQARVAGLLAWLPVIGGHAVGAPWWLFASLDAEPMPSFDLSHIATASEIPRELGAVIGATFGAWAVVILCRLPGALHHARSRQQVLERLRRSGTRHEGVLTQVRFSNVWVHDEPFFTVEVSYDAAGETRVVPARMRTSADRVPVVGTRMVVLADGHGSVCVELDDTAEAVFEAEGRYRAPEG